MGDSIVLPNITTGTGDGPSEGIPLTYEDAVIALGQVIARILPAAQTGVLPYHLKEQLEFTPHQQERGDGIFIECDAVGLPVALWSPWGKLVIAELDPFHSDAAFGAAQSVKRQFSKVLGLSKLQPAHYSALPGETEKGSPDVNGKMRLDQPEVWAVVQVNGQPIESWKPEKESELTTTAARLAKRVQQQIADQLAQNQRKRVSRTSARFLEAGLVGLGPRRPAKALAGSAR